VDRATWGAYRAAAGATTIACIERWPAGRREEPRRILMHDVIHAAIANERVRDLVQSAGADRAARPQRRRPAGETMPREAAAARRGRRVSALLHLRARMN
jgi:hypothetical protein